MALDLVAVGISMSSWRGGFSSISGAEGSGLLGVVEPDDGSFRGCLRPARLTSALPLSRAALELSGAQFHTQQTATSPLRLVPFFGINIHHALVGAITKPLSYHRQAREQSPPLF